MKTKINYSESRATVLMAFCIAFFLLSIKVKGQTAVIMTLQNIVQTSANTFEYDMMIANTGTTSLALRGYSCGVNHTTGLENGGAITYTYISGSRDALLSSLPIPTTLYTAPNHLRLVTSAAATGNEVPLTTGVNYKLARVRVETSAASFPCNFNPFLPSASSALQLLTAAGKTECAAICYVNYPSTSNYLLYGIGNTSTGTSLNVLTGVIIPSPSGGTPFILNDASPSISNVTASNSYNWACNGLSYTVSGTYTCTTLDANGCVVTNTLNLTINNNTTSSMTIYTCNNTYTWNGITYNTSGTYTHTSLNPNGTTNTATLILFITTPATVNTSFTLPKTVYCIDDVITATTLMPSPNTDSTIVNQWNIYNANANCVPDYPNPPIVQNYGNSFSKELNNSQFIPGHCYVLQHGMYSNCLSYTSTISCFCISPTTEIFNVNGCVSYTWPANGMTYTSSGVYTNTSLNSAGCFSTATLNLTINQSSNFIVISDSITNTTCAGDSNGAILAIPSGGQGPYTYSWSNGATTQSISGLHTGTYSLAITDATGCSSSISKTISSPAPILVTADVTPVTTHNGSNGSINLNVCGGTAPYSFSWTSGTTTQNITGASSGNYEVLVLDSNLCSIGQGPSIYYYEGECVFAFFNVVVPEVPPFISEPTGAILGSHQLLDNGDFENSPLQYFPDLCNTYCNNSNDCDAWTGYPTNDCITAKRINYPSSTGTSIALSNYLPGWQFLGTNANKSSGFNSFIHYLNKTAEHGSPSSGQRYIQMFGNGNGIKTTRTIDPNIGGFPNRYIQIELDAATFGGITHPIPPEAANGPCLWISGHGLTNYRIISVLTSTSNPSLPALTSSSLKTTNFDGYNGSNGFIDGFMGFSQKEADNLSWHHDIVFVDVPEGYTTIEISILTEDCFDGLAIDNVSATIGIYSAFQKQEIQCTGDSSGSLTLVIQDYGQYLLKPPYTYLWSNGAVTPTISNLSAGSYSVVVTDANGKVVTNSATLINPDPIQISSEVSPLSSFGATDGSIALSVLCGTPPYSYLWNDGDTSQNRTGLAEGQYTVTITDNSSASGTFIFPIPSPDPAYVCASLASPSTGSFEGYSSSGFPYHYNFNLAQLIPVASELPLTASTSWRRGANISGPNNNGKVYVLKNTYPYPTTLTTQPARGSNFTVVETGASIYRDFSIGTCKNQLKICLSALTYYYYEFQPNKASTFQIKFEYYNSSNQIIGTYNSYKTASQYLTSNGNIYHPNWTRHYASTSGNFPSNVAKVRVYLIAISGFVGFDCINIYQDGCPPLVLTVDPTCPGATTGTVTIPNGSFAGLNASAPYSYQWSTGDTTSSITGLAAGTYSVTVKDIDGEYVELDNLVLNSPNQLFKVDSISNVICTNGNNGAIYISPEGGTAPYTYQWSNGSNSQDVTGLTSGTYTLTSTDALGCSESKSFSLDSIQQVNIKYAATPVSAHGASDGAIAIQVLCGTPPYSFSWSNGDTSQNLTGLGEGQYNLTIVDGNSSTSYYPIPIPSPDPPNGCSSVGCSKTGSFEISPSSMTFPFFYDRRDYANEVPIDGNINGKWRRGPNSYNPMGELNVLKEHVGSGTPANDGQKFVVSNNGGSIYTDFYIGACKNPLNICLAALTYYHHNGWFDENRIFGIVFEYYDNYGTTPQFSTSTYRIASPLASYSMTNTNPPWTLHYASTPVIPNDIVKVRIYLFSSISSCVAFDCVNVYQSGCPNPISNGGTTTCPKSATGYMAITTGPFTGLNPTSPYKYKWSTGDTTQSISGLNAGSYSVEVTDVDGESIEFDNLTIVDPAPLFQVDSVTNVTCAGANNGAINISITGGTAPYNYQWSNGASTQDVSGLSSGTYGVIVSDSNGCSKSKLFELNASPALNVSSVVTPVSSYGATDGTITINVLCGIPPYSFLWSDGDTSQNRTSLGAGQYNITIQDGSTNVTAYSIPVPSPDPVNNCSAIDCSKNKSGSFESNNSTAFSGTFNFNASQAIQISNYIPGNTTWKRGPNRVGNYSPNVGYVFLLKQTSNPLSTAPFEGNKFVVTGYGGSIYKDFYTGTCKNPIQVCLAALTMNSGANDGWASHASVFEIRFEYFPVDGEPASFTKSEIRTASPFLPSLGNIYNPNWTLHYAKTPGINIPANVKRVRVSLISYADGNNSVGFDCISLYQTGCAQWWQLYNTTCNGTSNGKITTQPMAITGLNPNYPFSYNWSNGSNGQTANGLSAGVYSLAVTDADGEFIELENLVLTEPAPIINSFTETVCESFTWAVNGVTYTASGIYTHTSLNSFGCDVNEILTLTIKPFYDCYCTSFATLSSDQKIYNVTVAGGSTNPLYAYTNGCINVAPGPGSSLVHPYSNFKTLGNLASISQGGTVPFTIAEDECDGLLYNYNTFGISIWIDYNHNGSFNDPGEQVFATSTLIMGPQTVSGSFPVPSTAMIGQTCLRVVVSYDVGSNIGTCGETYGETEDYLIDITPPLACAGTPAPGNTIASKNPVCFDTAVNLSLQNLPTNNGITFQWYNNAGAIIGATNSTYSFIMTTANTYYCAVTCTNSGLTTNSNPVTVALTPFIDCYCSSKATLADEVEIYQVMINGSSTNPLYANANSCTTLAPGPNSVLHTYSNFKTLGSLTTITQGSTIPFTITENECQGIFDPFGTAIWIDFNHNASFADPGELVFVETVALSGPRNVTGTFIVPATALNGQTVCRCKVIKNYAGANNVFPCGLYTYGETEDYLINIGPVSTGTTLNLKCFIEGYMNGDSTMQAVLSNQGEPTTSTACDSIDVELRDANSPYGVMASSRTLLNQNGTATCLFTSTVAPGNYYIAVKHRNGLQTWSSIPLLFDQNSPVVYNFTTSSSQAYGSNQVQVSPGVWAFFSGDVVADENIDLLDIGEVETDISNFQFGYYATDINGDGNIDLLDIPPLETNISNFIFSNHP